MAESFCTMSSVYLANAKSRKPEILYRCNGTSLSQDHSGMNRPLGWELNCIDDRKDSTLQPKNDHCIKEDEGSFGLTEVPSCPKNGNNVDENLKLNLDLTLSVNPVEKKHRVPHPKSIVQSAGVKQARILTERKFDVPLSNRQDCNSDMYTDSRNTVSAVDGFRWGYHTAIVGQPRPGYGIASVPLKEHQQKPPLTNWNEAKHFAFSSNTSSPFRSFATNSFRMASVDGVCNLSPENKGRTPNRAYKRNSFCYLQKPSIENQQAASFVQSLNNSLYVKVKMEGMFIGRKVNLKAYESYETLARALENMFQRTTEDHIRTCIAMGNKDIVHPLLIFDPSTDFVLTYEDSNGECMLVGDVPWETFLNTVKRLWIIKTSGTNAVAPKCSKKRKAI